MLLVALPLHAGVTVSYGDPDRFNGCRRPQQRSAQVMLTLERYLQELGDRYLQSRAI